MLHIITTYADLDGPRLMTVYAESNRENTDYFFPDLADKALAVKRVEEGFLTFLREEFFTWPGPAYYVLEEAGEWVSALRLNEIEPGLYYLEALETRPDSRGRGFASRLLTGVQESLKREGPFRLCDCVGRRNLSSRLCHERCGFRAVAEPGFDWLRGEPDDGTVGMMYAYKM